MLGSRDVMLDYAKACVEVPISETYPDSLRFKIGGREVEVGVEYMWLPAICSLCNKLGHKEPKCQNRTGTNTNTVGENARGEGEVPVGNMGMNAIQGEIGEGTSLGQENPAGSSKTISHGQDTAVNETIRPEISQQALVVFEEVIGTVVPQGQCQALAAVEEIVANPNHNLSLVNVSNDNNNTQQGHATQEERNQFAVLVDTEDDLEDDISDKEKDLFSDHEVESTQDEVLRLKSGKARSNSCSTDSSNMSAPSKARTRAQRRSNEEVTSPIYEKSGKKGKAKSKGSGGKMLSQWK
ncbi:hypothetical protein IFM89_018316 [Coptis chinensis]|uniref:DUF4283 domain-containing protein n=1 Tax=Coptis chinensis TaxID=261450 RepID=A0A835GY92_9MAGN|nr:hypothetical protein IFM89_018316 [Coptis chinensis]